MGPAKWLAVLMMPWAPLAAGASSSESEALNAAEELLRAAQDTQISESDRRFLLNTLRAISKPAFRQVKRESEFLLTRLSLSEYRAAEHPNDPEPPTRDDLGSMSEETPDEPRSCTESPDHGCSTSPAPDPFHEVNILAKARRTQSRESWTSEVRRKIKDASILPRTLENLRLRVRLAVLLTYDSPDEAVQELQRLVLDHDQIIRSALLFMVSILPDTDMLRGDRLQIEGLVRFIQANFRESGQVAAQLFTQRPVETTMLLKALPDDHLRLAILVIVVQTQSNQMYK